MTASYTREYYISILLLTLPTELDIEGLMNVCLPYFTIENIMDKLNTKFWFSTIQESSDENYGKYVETMIRKVEIPVKVVLGINQICVSDWVNLQCGDIIRLDTKTDSELSVYVGNIKKFTALPGTSKDKYAVRVTSVIREEE